MAHKVGIVTLNHTLGYILIDNIPMGGISVLLAGDFRQTLPVISEITWDFIN